MTRKFFLLAALAIVLPNLAIAHHSHVNYEPNDTIMVRGTVTEVQWINPHTWFFINVMNEDGVEEEWALESGAPSQLMRRGWSAESIKPGDEITAIVKQLRGGANGGLLGTIILSDGTALCDPFGANLPLTTVCQDNSGNPLQ
jgi:hypothetical protein